jgi:hypothetical protein
MIYYGSLVRYLAAQVKTVDLGECGTGRSGRGTAVSDPTVLWCGGGVVEKKTARHLSTAKSHNAWISLVNYSISELYVGS